MVAVGGVFLAVVDIEQAEVVANLHTEGVEVHSGAEVQPKVEARPMKKIFSFVAVAAALLVAGNANAQLSVVC